MPNIIDILARALSLRQETALNSITPNRAGGIMYDTLLVLNQMQLEGGSLLISKVYASVSAMEADTTPTSDLTGRALKPGQLVVIVTSDSSSSDMGSEYRFNGPGSWTYVGKVGGLPLDTVPTQSSTKGITSGGVYTALAAMKAEGYKYMGIATPGSGGTAPGTPNQPVFYIAGPGSYPNFGSITVASGYLGFIKYSSGSWTVESVAVGKDYDEQISTLDGQISQLEAEVTGLPSIEIDFSDYSLVNGYIDETTLQYITVGNYGLYHRCKFVPIDAYHGRTIRIVHNPQETNPVKLAVLQSMPDVSAEYSSLVLADGFEALVSIAEENSPYDFVVPANANYLCFYILDTRYTWDRTPKSTTILEENGLFYTKQETDESFAKKESVEEISDFVITEETEETNIQLTEQVGYFLYDTGERVTESADDKSCAEVVVVPGEKYYVSSYLRSAVIALLVEWDANGNYVGYVKIGTGTGEIVSNYAYIVPNGVAKIGISNADSYHNPDAMSLKREDTHNAPTFYTKDETKEMVDDSGKYGVKWSVSDINDLGSRELSAVGKTATIGIGNTDGNSDFDNIWPWAGIKRCNIKTNANGASIVTFEGETGFALDGSNGDVFVRIPKFKTDHYVKDGYEHIVIGDGYVHPAFIEDGEELEEIFIGAFEASGDSSALFSKGGVIPANNITGASFLAGAKARGTKYSLYDMRCVDALWRLMAVEYGCRNSNRIFGWGYANFTQPDNLSHLKVVVSAQNTNTITLAKPTRNSIRVEFLQSFASGNNLCICENTQTNIIAQRKIVSVECASLDDNVVITFEGDPIDVNTDMFVGNAPCDCNYCETIGNSWKLNWHTGRANRPVLSGIGYVAETCNPCRYRWVENPVGNVWHSLPDVTFKDLQMYVCKNMKDYEMLRYTPPYTPVGAVLPEQNSNGDKFDVNTVARPNYWITGLLLDIFAKGNNFGKSFDTAHDGTITSTKGFGGYYYLYNDTRYIANGGGYDHLWRCNMLTNRAWQNENTRWYLYGARLMFKNI